MFKKSFEIREHAGAVFSLTKDNNFVYSASADKYVTRWKIESGEQDSFAIKCDASVYKILYLEPLKLLVIGTSKGDLHIIDTCSKQEYKFLKYHQVAIFEIQFDALKNRLYVGDADGNFTVWDTITWKLILSLPFDCGKIRSIIIVEEKELIFFGAQDGEIRVLNRQNFNLLSSFIAHKDGCLSIFYTSKKSSVFFTSGKDGFIKAWDLNTFQNVLSIPAHNEAIYKLDSIGDYLISISRDKTLKFWRINSLDFVCKLERKNGGHSHSINDLEVINQTLFTSSDDKRIIRWELENAN